MVHPSDSAMKGAAVDIQLGRSSIGTSAWGCEGQIGLRSQTGNDGF